MTQKLTPKQILFINEYLIDFNATRSAIAAGYSKKTARKIGQENLTKPDIQEAIAKAIEERNKRTEINADWVQKHKTYTESVALKATERRLIEVWN